MFDAHNFIALNIFIESLHLQQDFDISYVGTFTIIIAWTTMIAFCLEQKSLI